MGSTAFLRQLREQNERFAGSDRSLAGSEISQNASLPVRSSLVSAGAAAERPLAPPGGGTIQKPVSGSSKGKKPLPIPPPKPVTLSKRDWAAERIRAERVFPEVAPARDGHRPARTYEEASSSYVGGLAETHLEETRAVQVEPPSAPSSSVDSPATKIVGAPSIAIEAPAANVEPPKGSASDVATQVNVLSRANGCLVCAQCGASIEGKILNAMSKRFHPSCFRCAACGIALEHVAYHEKAGEAYCHYDYHELFTIRCDHCKTPIIDEQFVRINDEEMGGEKVFHELHFFCASCGDPFVDAKYRGDPKPFVLHQGHAYCQPCDIKWRAPKCARCKKPIAEDILKALGQTFHEKCFVCAVCNRLFSDSTFFVQDDKPVCRDCLKRL